MATAVLVVTLAACGVNTTGTPAAPPGYTGPLYLTPDQQTSATDRAAGAAGRVATCRTRIAGDKDDPDQLHEGAATATPAKAIKAAAGEGYIYTDPDDYSLERRDEDRALFTQRVEGVIRQAVIVHRGPTADRGGKVGW